MARRQPDSSPQAMSGLWGRQVTNCSYCGCGREKERSNLETVFVPSDKELTLTPM